MCTFLLEVLPKVFILDTSVNYPMSRISEAKFPKMRPYFQVCSVDDVLTTNVLCNFDKIRLVKQVSDCSVCRP